MTKKDKWFDAIEARIYYEQWKLIKKEHGKRAADAANYGWGVDGNDNSLSVATKVYLRSGNQVLVSETNYPKGKIEHEWHDY